jgi:hypothetical protein
MRVQEARGCLRVVLVVLAVHLIMMMVGGRCRGELAMTRIAMLVCCLICSYAVFDMMVWQEKVARAAIALAIGVSVSFSSELLCVICAKRNCASRDALKGTRGTQGA